MQWNILFVTIMCCVQGVAKSIPLIFFIFPQRLKILKCNYTRLFCIHIYAKLLNVIQLSLTLTKLCHIKCVHLMNLFILQEKCKKTCNINISTTVRLISTESNTMTQSMSLKCMTVKNFKLQDGWQPPSLESKDCNISWWCGMARKILV